MERSLIKKLRCYFGFSNICITENKPEEFCVTFTFSYNQEIDVRELCSVVEEDEDMNLVHIDISVPGKGWFITDRHCSTTYTIRDGWRAFRQESTAGENIEAMFNRLCIK